MYLALTMFTIHISHCSCFVGYEMFQGFDISATSPSNSSTGENETMPTPITPKTLMETSTVPSGVPTVPSLSPVGYPRFNCSEDEKPFNIGAYEVPTQRDLVLLIQKTLIRMFNGYQEKALDFLQDIREATKASSDIEKKCFSQGRNQQNYRMCVKQVSKKCEVITKSLVTSLERQRLDVSAFIEGTICNVTEMRADPVQVIKTLAKEQASLEFALPGFLRLLGACSAYCDKRMSKKRQRKPLRHMTDQDLVVKHFLTKKNYLQLLKGSK